MQWSDFQTSYLSANQQQKSANFEAIGKAARDYQSGRGPKPDISGITLGQAKGARDKYADMVTLIGAAQDGAKYVIQTLQLQNAQQFDDANPPQGG